MDSSVIVPDGEKGRFAQRATREELAKRENRILLVSMPLSDPRLPNYGLEQLAALLREGGMPCDVLYGSLLLSPAVPMHIVHGIGGQGIFSPLYFDGLDPGAHLRELIDELSSLGDRATGGCGNIRQQYEFAMKEAAACLVRCLEAIELGKYDIVGFSIIFDSQKMASAALAKQLKKRESRLKIAFGGSGCYGSMGGAILETFPEVDVVLQGEADESFPRTIHALRHSANLAEIPNCLFRAAGGIRSGPEASWAVSNLRSLRLDYSTYIRQFRAANFDDRIILMFESSRGCWWGQRRQCTFCGVSDRQMPFRIRSASGILESILDLYVRYRPHTLYAADMVIDSRSVAPVLESLAQLRSSGALQDLRLFFEVRPNLSRKQVDLMAAAGVKYVQPGIENLSTPVLQSIGKGTTVLQQIELLKWLCAYGIKPVYSLISGLPAANACHYADNISLARRVHHLPPPLSVNRLMLHRFSPYAETPRSYGIVNVRPFGVYRVIYQIEDERRLLDMSFAWNYDLARDDWNDVLIAEGEMLQAITEWQRAFERGAALRSVRHGSECEIWSELDGATLRHWHLTGLEAAIYADCECSVGIAEIVRRRKCSEQEADNVLSHLSGENLVLCFDGRYLSNAVPVNPREAESAITESEGAWGCSARK